MKTVFKNYKLLVVLLLMISFCACSSDDSKEDEPTVTELLENKWFAIGFWDTTTDPETYEEVDDCARNIYYNFLSDGTLLSQNYFLDADDVCESSDIETYTYILSADGTQVIVEFEDGTSTLIITAIDDTTLELYNKEFPEFRYVFNK
ncbi:hypothetical protein FPF71_01630 [Algibacter amylolyticus]|uniref:Lipocalin-like domain-containing protein n=1 Tax=Algibacter amylolyticus TaxID=1608400 RepID=A0A5M7BDS8_9FLAO|nr:lipocalin family protein [Algibacter amylolyticus]KAA5827569.1 hypothetical protein F2B50_01630 [Algibacter amylolyticus]MBB5266775.1 hypothetical protein [Algibacter amylolyticus]TSJ81814.1 hypothetical protein FPF71_01630 [Algibacter amylolyticus]